MKLTFKNSFVLGVALSLPAFLTVFTKWSLTRVVVKRGLSILDVVPFRSKPEHHPCPIKCILVLCRRLSHSFSEAPYGKKWGKGLLGHEGLYSPLWKAKYKYIGRL